MSKKLRLKLEPPLDVIVEDLLRIHAEIELIASAIGKPVKYTQQLLLHREIIIINRRLEDIAKILSDKSGRTNK